MKNMRRRERQLPAAGRRTGSPDCRPGRRPEGDTDKEPEPVVTPPAALNTSMTLQLVPVGAGAHRCQT